MAEVLPDQPADDFDPEQKRWENLVDQGVFSPAQADLNIYGHAKPFRPQASTPVSRPARRAVKRGGRSFSEPSDSDLDPAWNPPYVKPDEAEIVSASPGRRAVAAELAKIAMRADHRKAAGDIRMELVLSRARAERRARQRL